MRTALAGTSRCSRTRSRSWRWRLCCRRCRCRWSSITWGASTRPKGHRPKPLACCAACWTAATPGSSSREPTCALPCGAQATPTPCRRPERSAWADANRGGTITDSFLEGPVFDGVGNLYVTDIPWGRIFRIDPQGAWTLVAEYDGEPNGMKFMDAGTLLITDYKNGLMRLDIATGRVTPYLERRNSERFKGVNDLIFDADGNLYFTDQGQSGLHDPSGRLYRLRPNGQLDLLLANVPSPNGVALSPEGRVLYLAATRGN